MAGGDISATLRVNVVVDTSGAEAQIRDAISRINTGNNVIRLRADASEALKEIHSLQSEIQALSKKPVSVGVTSAFGKMVNTGFGAASEQLSNINQQIQALGNSGGATKSLTQVSDIVQSLKTEMTSLSEAMDRFQGINISLGNGKGGLSNTIAYGNAVRDTITQLKGQAAELEGFLKEYYHVQDGIEASLKLLQGTGETGNLLNLQDTILNPKSSLQDQMASLRDYIGLIQSVASNKGIDLTGVTSGFTQEAARLVEDCNKVATGEKQIADGAEKLKGIFGGSVNGEALSSQLESISSAIQNISTSVTALTSGESPFTEITSSVTRATEAVERLSAAFKDLNVKTSGGSGSGSKGGIDDVLERGSDQWTSKMNNVTKQIQSMERFQNGMNKISGLDQSGVAELEKYNSALEKMKQLSADLDKGTMTKGEYNTRFADIAKEASEAKVALQEVADIQKEINVEQAKQKEPKMFEEDSVKQQNALREIAKLQQQIAQNSQKWSAAAHGSSADAYSEYIKQSEALDELNQKVKDCTISEEEYAQEASKIKATMQECAASITSAGENTQGFGAQLAGAFRYFSMYFGMTRMVMKGIQTVKQMVQASIEIESAMNRIQIVTGATDAQMGQFFDSASQQAQDLGQNITDVAESIETFSRLGYSLNDATDLSKYATIMSNVADTTVDAATTGLTSIIKGFGMEASDAEHVSDVLINVGQKYAISAEELMEAFERGGAAMNASGTSFEESAALFAATNASLEFWRAA